jgi:glycosyltransferase involved in cell wall biosynthesis
LRAMSNGNYTADKSIATLSAERAAGQFGNRNGNSSEPGSAAIIIAPPWPHSGTARVLQNQIEFYRHRGFRTFFIAVPFHWAYRKESAIWANLAEGIHGLGADRTFIADLETRRYEAAKYWTSLRHGFHGTSLDWMIGMARSTRLPDDAIQLFGSTPIALLHVNHVYTMGFALGLRKKLTNRTQRPPIILDTHDVQAHLLAERGDLNPWTKKKDSAERLARTEIAMLQNVDVLMHLSVDDIKFFQQQLPNKPHILSMPTIDEAFVSKVSATPAQPESIDLLFVGQSHAPNLAAMKWFFADVWPHIAHKNYNLKVVGAVELFVRESLPEVYEKFRSCFVGQATELAPYYRAAKCVIAPMVSGSGISIKTIEALALGKPFVGTSKAYRGMDLAQITAAGLRAYDDPQEFAEALAYALANEAEAAAKSRAAYDRMFSTEAAFASRDIALDLLRKKQPVAI